jgi:hypothetical protein
MGLITKLQSARAIYRSGGWKGLWWKCRQYLWQRRFKKKGFDLDYVSCEDLQYLEFYYHYAPTPGPELARVLHALHVGQDDSIIDIGCGKGGTLITMASFPFKKIAGLEMSMDLAKTAEANLARAGINRVQINSGDARSFSDLDEFNYIYLYNPFGGDIFEQFVSNLKRSLARQPRPMTIVYRNPKCHEMLIKGGFDRVRRFDFGEHPWFIYRDRDVS